MTPRFVAANYSRVRKPQRPLASPKSALAPAAARRCAQPVPRWRQSAAPLLIVVVGLLAYRNTFDVPLVFDDLERIEHNPQLRSLWPVWEPMAQTNRPLGMYTFAVNYALDGYRVWGYHAVNLAIHLAAGLLLFGIVRNLPWW